MPLDPGTVHRFAMLERAVKSFAKTGRFDESLKLVEEMLEIAPEDAGLSKLKARVAAELVHQAIQARRSPPRRRSSASSRRRFPQRTSARPRKKSLGKPKNTCTRCDSHRFMADDDRRNRHVPQRVRRGLCEGNRGDASRERFLLQGGRRVPDSSRVPPQA